MERTDQATERMKKMYHADARLVRVVMDMRVQEAQRSAAVLKRQNQSLVASRLSNLAGQLGHSLVTLGQRLEQYDLPQPSR